MIEARPRSARRALFGPILIAANALVVARPAQAQEVAWVTTNRGFVEIIDTVSDTIVNTMALPGLTCFLDPASGTLGQGSAADKPAELELKLQTVDHFVPHISTIPANAGEEVQLFVRERFLSGDEKSNDNSFKDKCRRKGPVVLLLEGATQPALPNFDTSFEN